MQQSEPLIDLCKNYLRWSVQSVVDEARRRRRLQIDFGRAGTVPLGFLNERRGRIHDR
jgi:hypothetical protein